MAVSIPLRYSERVFAHARVDDDAENLVDVGYYSVTIPRKMRRVAAGRPDVILAMLNEDPLAVAGCTPFVSMFGTQVLLVHMVVNGELGRLMVSTVHDQFTAFDVAATVGLINQLRGTIGRIAYVNNDKTDCRRENLRVL